MNHETKRFEKQTNEFGELEDASLTEPPKVVSKCRLGCPVEREDGERTCMGKTGVREEFLFLDTF